MGNFLCFDLGTTKIKSALISYDGNIIYSSEEKAKTYSDDEGVYQKPEEYFNTVVSEIKEIKKRYPSHLSKAESLICSGQMAGILGIDMNWEVVFPWTYSVDTRANSYLSEIEGSMGGEIRESSGGVPFMAAKMKWIKENFPKDYKKIYKFINLTTYVAGRMCNLSGDDAFIDYSVLTMSGLADIEKGRWNRKICSELGIDINRLPHILRPFECVGYIDKNRFGTEEDIKVLVGIGDQIAGFIGAGILDKNDLVDVAGTYTVLGYCTDSFIADYKNKIISSIFSGIDGIYYNLSVVAVGGYVYSWFKEKFNYDDKKNPVQIKDTDGLYFIPHIGGRSSPSQPYYEGTWVGIKWHHDLDSFYISLLESIGYELSYVLNWVKELNALREDSIREIKVIGGGSKNSIWNSIKSNILNLKYLVMKEVPFEIIGSFLVAKYGSNFKEGYKQLIKDNIISIDEEVYPQKERVNFYKKHIDKYIKVVDKIGKIYCDLNIG